MLQMVKRELYLNASGLWFYIFLVPMGYVFLMPRISIYFVIILLIVFNSFYYDSKSHVNRSFVSMPIRKEDIVLGKYIFFLLMMISFLLYQWIVDWLAHFGLPYLNSHPLNAITIMFIFTSISIFVSIAILYFYTFKSFARAVTFIIVTFFVLAFGFGIILGIPFTIIDPIILVILNTIGIQPYIVLTLLSLVTLFISYSISAFLFSKREIV